MKISSSDVFTKGTDRRRLHETTTLMYEANCRKLLNLDSHWWMADEVASICSIDPGRTGLSIVEIAKAIFDIQWILNSKLSLHRPILFFPVKR